MNEPSLIWHPRYTLTPAIVRGLMQIEAVHAAARGGHSRIAPPRATHCCQSRCRGRSMLLTCCEGLDAVRNDHCHHDK